MKRTFDVVSSFFGLLLLSPIFLLIALGIKLTMPGPVFFKQERVGLHGNSFLLIKFRSMKVNSQASKGSFDAGDTSRITPLGRILRSSKLDELPQLINVLKGEMSIVGPRPEVRKWTEEYKERWNQVHKVKPGITDNASIAFRSEEQILQASEDPNYTYREVILPKKLEYYIDYVNNNSFFGDLKIIFLTLAAIFKTPT